MVRVYDRPLLRSSARAEGAEEPVFDRFAISATKVRIRASGDGANITSRSARPTCCPISSKTNMHPTARFVDTGKHLAVFADEVHVICIECGVPGIVTASSGNYSSPATFQCKGCQIELDTSKGHWVGPVRMHGRQPCGYCGHQWLTPSVDYVTPPTSLPKQIVGSCNECGHETLVAAKLSRTRAGDGCRDPHFGLPLRLSVDTRFGAVWAYNQKHVAELSAYVTAKLRVRQISYNSAMFSRLPKWMKLAKHRGEISKALAKLAAIP
jgi:hypothetical protein